MTAAVVIWPAGVRGSARGAVVGGTHLLAYHELLMGGSTTDEDGEREGEKEKEREIEGGRKKQGR